MRRSIAIALSLFLLCTSTAWAVITHNGNVQPLDPPASPANWTSSTEAYIGNTATGTVTVDCDNVVNDPHILWSNTSYLGHNTGTVGTVTVTDAYYNDNIHHWIGAEWGCGPLHVGYEGTGNLYALNGGQVYCDALFIGHETGSTGTVEVSGKATYEYQVGEETLYRYRYSSLNPSGSIYVGHKGTGELIIGEECTISTIDYNNTYVGCCYNDGIYDVLDPDNSGTDRITISGTLETHSFLAGSNSIFGDGGEIYADGHIIDKEGVTISNNNPNFYYGGPGGEINVHVYLDLSSSSESPSQTEYFGAGHNVSGEVTIDSGADIYSSNGIVGFAPGSTGEVNVTGAGTSWTSTFYVGYESENQNALNVTDGATISGGGYIGYGAITGEGSTASGTVTIDGTGSEWTGSGNIAIGEFGTGVLNIQNGGTANIDGYVGHQANSTGTIYVSTGVTDTAATLNSTDLYVGHNGTGTLHVGNGGAANIDYLYVGYNSTSTGTVTLENSSTLATTNIDIGRNGIGTLDIQSGSNGSCTGLYLGTGGTVNVWGWDLSSQTYSTLTSTYDATIEGNLNVYVDNDNHGGKLETCSAYIAYDGGTENAKVEVKGITSRWDDTGGIRVGYNGKGNLTIAEGGTVHCGSESGDPMLYVGYCNGSSGTVDVEDSGSTLQTEGCCIGCSGYGNGLGTVTVSGGTWTNGSSLSPSYLGIGSPALGNEYSLIVESGGTMTNYGNAVIHPQGAVKVEGDMGSTPHVASIWTNSDGLSITRDSNHQGTLNISHGGIVICNNDDAIGKSCVISGGKISITGSDLVLVTKLQTLDSHIYNRGEVELDGSTGIAKWESGGDMEIGVNPYVSSGTLKVLGGGFVDNGEHNTRVYGNIVTEGEITYDSRITVSGTGYHGEVIGYVPSTFESNNLQIGHSYNDGSWHYCPGFMDVENGGQVVVNTNSEIRVDGSVVTVSGQNVTGDISTWTTHGSLGIFGGELLVENGGRVIVDSNLTASSTLTVQSAGSVSSYNGYVNTAVTVTGSGSQWTNSSNLYISSGNGNALNITNGASVSSATGRVGYGSSEGTVIVDGTNSTWTNSGDLYVGDEDTGTLIIKNGASVSDQAGYIGLSGSTGVVTVRGSNSTWTNSGAILAGNSGNGTLNVVGGATASSPFLIVGSETGSAGTILVYGGLSTLTTSYAAYIGSQDGSTGNVTVEGNGTEWTVAGNLRVGSSSGGKGNLTIRNVGLVKVGGTLTTTDSDSSNDDGFVNMKNGAMLALCGDGDDSLEDFFNLIGGTDAIRFWDNDIVGDDKWNSLNLTNATRVTPGTIDSFDEFSLQYFTTGDLAGYTLLTVGVPLLGGDANGDGTVDASDATILNNYWGCGVSDGSIATWDMGDFNGDGMVDGSDATILNTNWGSSGGGLAAVPEPSTVALIFTALLALGVTAIRKRSGK